LISSFNSTCIIQNNTGAVETVAADTVIVDIGVDAVAADPVIVGTGVDAVAADPVVVDDTGAVDAVVADTVVDDSDAFVSSLTTVARQNRFIVMEHFWVASVCKHSGPGSKFFQHTVSSTSVSLQIKQ
jgi:hypothetical protein